VKILRFADLPDERPPAPMIEMAADAVIDAAPVAAALLSDGDEADC
jgi:hypothetical protein